MLKIGECELRHSSKQLPPNQTNVAVEPIRKEKFTQWFFFLEREKTGLEATKILLCLSWSHVSLRFVARNPLILKHGKKWCWYIEIYIYIYIYTYIYNYIYISSICNHPWLIIMGNMTSIILFCHWKQQTKLSHDGWTTHRLLGWTFSARSWRSLDWRNSSVCL